MRGAVLSILCVLAGRPAVADVVPVDPDVARAVAELYDRPLEPQELEDALAGLGAPALPALFLALADESSACTSPEHGVDAHPSSDAASRATRAAILRAPASAVRELLARLAAQELSAEQRVVALELTAVVGERAELPLVALLAHPPSEASRVDLSVQRAAQAAFGEIFVRDPEALGAARDLYGRVHEWTRAPLVRGIARAGSPSMAVLASLLGRRPQVDGLILLELGRLSERDPDLEDELLRSRVRDLLRSADPDRVRQAIVVVGNLADVEAIDPLIELLQAESRDLRERARGALCAITGQRLRPTHDVWHTWWRAEVDWLARSAPALFSDLRAADPARVAAALLEVGKHGVHRRTLADAVVPVLARPEPELVRMAAALLGRLGARSVIPDLEDGLAAREPAVREACAAALRRLTGKDLPADPAAWVGVR